MDTFDFLVTFGLKTPCCDSDVNLCSCATSLDANNDVNEIPFNWEQEVVPLPDTIKTPINIPLLLEILKLDPNRTRANFLSNGFSVGFRIGFRGTLYSTRPRNLRSARLHPRGVETAVQKELRMGHTSGPFLLPPFSITHCSPLGAVKKPDGTCRLILDLSSPRGRAINEGIPKDDFSVQYSKFDDAVKLVRTAGRGCSMAKIDIQSAFRIIPVHPDDWNKLCFSLDGRYFVDTRLSFGSRSSPFIFNTFAQFLAWFLSAIIGISLIIHYLDDFFIAAPEYRHCKIDMDKMLAACSYLGVPVNNKKVFGPSSILTYLGIELDSNLMICRLPVEKLSEIKLLIKTWLSKKSCKKRELSSLIGKLSFAS